MQQGVPSMARVMETPEETAKRLQLDEMQRRIEEGDVFGADY